MSLKMYPKTPPHPLAGVKEIIAIAAGKGGVGKSTVTVNLALALHALGYRVGVMDTDVYGPSLRRMLPEESLPTQKGTEIMPALCRGIPMISMAYFRKDNQASAVRAPIANGIITQFIEQVAWGELDFLLIDFPPGTGDIQLTLSQKAALSGAIMVTTPQEVALMDVRRAMDLFDQVQVPLLGVVENMSYYLHPESHEPLYLFGKGGGERLAQESHIPFLGAIPVDPLLSQYGDSGESIFTSPDLPIAKTFTQLAKQVIQQVAHAKKQPASCKITQRDPQSLTITWSDGFIGEYPLSTLQQNCPCAACVDEQTGQRRSRNIHPDVHAVTIANVGRYALRFQFSSGCSTGIYDFAYLRALAQQPTRRE